MLTCRTPNIGETKLTLVRFAHLLVLGLKI